MKKFIAVLINQFEDIKNLLIVLVIVFPFALQAQPDTNLYQTSTSQNVASWLKNLSVATGSGHISILNQQMGGMLISGNGRTYVDSNSVTAYYANTIIFNTDLNIGSKNLQREFRKMQQAGAYMARCPALMPWGIIEPSQGTYHYEFIDSTVKIAGKYGIKLVGTVLPLADWSQTCNPTNTSPFCSNLWAGGGDFFFLNNQKTGPVCSADTTYFYQFAQNLVERYDGDGVNDMPGLTLPVTVWEFGNECETPCSNYTPAAYKTDLNIFKRAMKAACTSCTLINGGWGGLLSDSTFWKSVIQNSNADLDGANFHSNAGRMLYPFSFTKMLYPQSKVFKEQINQLSLPWKTWVTEWGIYSGSPNSLPNRTEEEQASLYTKLYCWSAANNLTNYFYDLKGTSNTNIGSAALIQENIGPKDSLFARLFFYTQKLLEYKFRTYDSVKVVQMDTSTSFTQGDIRFYKSNSTHYVLWGLNSLPSGLSGVKNVTDIYGNVTTQNVSSLTLPLGANPIIVEDTSSTTAINELANQNLRFTISPNPFSMQTVLQTDHLLNNATLTVYNLFGQTVKQIKNINGQAIVFNRNNLSSGLYFVRLTEENKIYTNKLVIADK